MAKKEAKAVEQLTVKECLVELKKLSKDVEFGTTWNSKTPINELQKLVAEGRKVLASDDADEEKDSNLGGEEGASPEGTGKAPAADVSAEEEDESDEEVDEDEADGEDDVEQSKPKVKTGSPIIPGVPRGVPSITVIVQGGETRTYWEAEHGAKWETYAKQFAEHQQKVLKRKVTTVRN